MDSNIERDTAKVEARKEMATDLLNYIQEMSEGGYTTIDILYNTMAELTEIEENG